MQSVVETAEYLKDAKQASLSEEERAAIVAYLARNPEAGDEIRGTGGVQERDMGVGSNNYDGTEGAGAWRHCQKTAYMLVKVITATNNLLTSGALHTTVGE